MTSYETLKLSVCKTEDLTPSMEIRVQCRRHAALDRCDNPLPQIRAVGSRYYLRHADPMVLGRQSLVSWAPASVTAGNAMCHIAV